MKDTRSGKGSAHVGGPKMKKRNITILNANMTESKTRRQAICFSF